MACGANTAHAAVLWYDGFSLDSEGGDYVDDAPLPGTSGGSGSFFTGPWVAADPGDAASWPNAQSSGLSRPGLTEPVVGGAAGREVQFDCCVFTRTSKLFDSPWGGFTDPDGTFYMGYLINFGTGPKSDPNHHTVEMHFDGFDDNLNRNLMLGISNFAGLGNKLALNVRDSTTDTSTNAVFAEGARLSGLAFQGTHYVVMKFEMSTSTDDVISAFLDPVGTTEPAPSASITVGQFLADRLSTNAQFTFQGPDPSAAGQFDELRVGTEFADVAINTQPLKVPEPASLSLLGLGAMGLLLAARRKRA
jgi:hypothetical protein